MNRNRELLDPDQEMKDSIKTLEGSGGDSELASCYSKQWQQYKMELALGTFSIAPKGTDEFYNSMERDRAEALAIRNRCRLAKKAM